jgi:hypothetical protein
MHKPNAIQFELLSGHLERVLTPLSIFSRARIKCRTDSIYLEAAKKSKTATISITVPSSLLQASKLTDLNAGINPSKLLPAVQNLDDDILIDLYIPSEGKIVISSDGYQFRTGGLDTKFIYNDNSCNNKLSDDYICTKITGTDLSRGLELASDIATHCRLDFCPNENSIIVSASGDSDSLEDNISVDNMQINIGCVKDGVQIKNYYLLKHLYEIYNIIPEATIVDLSIEQSELVMSYPIVDDVGSVTFRLAESVNP